MSGLFEKGRSGNPAGRPKARRPHVSAFDIVFDKTLTVSQNGVERELTVDEALQLKTYQAALKGSRMAVRAVLKMIEKREVALAAQAPKPAPPKSNPFSHIYDSDSADEAMRILGIASIHEDGSGGWADGKLKLETWAAQAAISRPGRRQLSEKNIDDVKLLTKNPDKLKWPRGRAQ
ncbi:MAG TPA: DUF5681 domain-containing protein [Sphingomicrobium sp.]|nr:DUF5681 domain-containing protein [Sphingomicrobium sp.]